MAKKGEKYHPNISQTKPNNSFAQQERTYVVAKKMLRYFGLEEDLIDVFTKRQRQDLLMVWFNQPTVKPEKERTVPRQYIKNIQMEVHKYMKQNFFGNAENQLTILDAAIYGASFLVNLSNGYERGDFESDVQQKEAASRIYVSYNKQKILDQILRKVKDRIKYLTIMYSKINFRLYGYDYIVEHTQRIGGISMKPTFYLTAQDCETKRFTYNDKERKAFRVINTQDDRSDAKEATVKRNEIFPNAKENEVLNIYVQSHALNRLKERLDIYSHTIQNLLIQNTFTYGLKVVPFEKQVLFSCLIYKDLTIGYFTFFVQENDIVITTFIPLVSANTPEGKKLHELLRLGKDDIIYLGMDKISFFLKVDFEQIPVLKQALIDSKIWQIKLALDRHYEKEKLEDDEFVIDANKTTFVKSFFDKLRKK